MALGYVNAGSLSATSATNVTLSLPITINGAILIGIAITSNNEVHTWPAGWTKVNQTDAGPSTTSSLAYRIANGSDTNPNITWTSSVGCGGQVFQYQGNANEALLSGGAGLVTPTATTTHAVAAITTTRANSFAIYLDYSGNNVDLGTPAGWTEDNDEGVGAPSGLRITIGHILVASNGGSSGAISVTGGTGGVMRNFELREPSVGGQTALQKYVYSLFGVD